MERAATFDQGASESAAELWILAGRALGLLAGEVAELLGVSRKTVYRYNGRPASVHASTIGDLAPHVHEKDAALAARMHAFAAESAARTGRAPPPPLPAPPPVVTAPPTPQKTPAQLTIQARSVVYAACEAMDAAPRAVKRGLLAALRHAREQELSLEEMERELTAWAKAAVKKKA